MTKAKQDFINLYSKNRHEFIWSSLNPEKILRSDGGIPVSVNQLTFYSQTDAIANIEALNPFIEEDLLSISEFTFKQNRFMGDTSTVTIYNTLKTYKGKRILLESGGFNFDNWIAKNQYYLCCDRAIPGECVCFIRTECDIHGARCNGSHD